MKFSQQKHFAICKLLIQHCNKNQELLLTVAHLLNAVKKAETESYFLSALIHLNLAKNLYLRIKKSHKQLCDRT